MNELNMNRRKFVKTASSVGVASALSPLAGMADNEKTEVWVIEGQDKVKMMNRALEVISSNGGMSNIDKLTLKVNAAWTRKPETGANTHPVFAETFIKGCRDAGIKEIKVPEHPCQPARTTFVRSGLQEAVENAGGEMIDLKSNQKSFRAVEIKQGKRLKEAEVAGDYLDTDMIVNMPIAKHHSGAKLTSAMKNWMGVVKDRGYWHRNDLHQCIADFSSFMQADWNIIDATSCMLDSGPQGPTDNMRHPNKLIVTQNPVSGDAYAANVVYGSIDGIKYLSIAHDMGLGETDLDKMKIHTFKV